MQPWHKPERRQVLRLDLLGHRAETDLGPELLDRDSTQDQAPMEFPDPVGVDVGLLGDDQRQQEAFERIGRAHHDPVHVDDEQSQHPAAGPVGFLGAGRRVLLPATHVAPTPSLGGPDLGQRESTEAGQQDPQEQQEREERHDRPHPGQDVVDRGPGVELDQFDRPEGGLPLDRLADLLTRLARLVLGKADADEDDVVAVALLVDLRDATVDAHRGRQELVGEHVEGRIRIDRTAQAIVGPGRGEADAVEGVGLLEDHVDEDALGGDLGQHQRQVVDPGEGFGDGDRHRPGRVEIRAVDRPAGGLEVVEAQPVGRVGECGDRRGVGDDDHRDRPGSVVVDRDVDRGVDAARARKEDQDPQEQ